MLLLALAVAWLTAIKPQASTPPDVILIVADDLGYADLGCYGNDGIRTPNLDRLASQGVRLTQFYSNGPECTPTRAALMSGRYQHRIGGLECAIGVGNAGRYDDAIRLCDAGELGLPPALNILPSLPKQRGYHAAAIGKWHLGYERKFLPLAQGFDEFFGPLGGGVDYFHHTEPAGVFLGHELPGEPMLYRNNERIDADGYLTHLITREALRVIEQQSSRRPETPLFLYVPYTAPHTPLQGPDDYQSEKLTGEVWNQGSRDTYFEMIEELDRGVGEILDAIDRHLDRDNTLVVFFSDNGPTSKGVTRPYTRTKGTLFEGGIHVPCIIRFPGRIDPFRVSDQMAISMDLTRSIARLTHPQAAAERDFDGLDLIQHIRSGTPNVPRTLFWRSRRGERTERAIRQGPWKYLDRQLDANTREQYLFNIERDPAEAHSHLDAYPALTTYLQERLASWESDVAPTR